MGTVGDGPQLRRAAVLAPGVHLHHTRFMAGQGSVNVTHFTAGPGHVTTIVLCPSTHAPHGTGVAVAPGATEELMVSEESIFRIRWVVITKTGQAGNRIRQQAERPP